MWVFKCSKNFISVEKGEKHRISHPDDVRLHPATQSGLVFWTEVDSGN